MWPRPSAAPQSLVAVVLKGPPLRSARRAEMRRTECNTVWHNTEATALEFWTWSLGRQHLSEVYCKWKLVRSGVRVVAQG